MSLDRIIRIWDTLSGACRKELKCSSEFPFYIIGPSKGTAIVWLHVSGIKLLDTTTNAVEEFNDPSRNLDAFAVSPDGTTFAVGFSFSSDGFMLDTDLGFLDITGVNSNHSLSSPSPALFVKEEWIYCGSDTLLWLHPEHRTKILAVRGNICALRNPVEGLSIIQFCDPREM
jgi:WD40 repeat protein